MDTRDVIIAPIITEKSTKDSSLGRFTFKVTKIADKNVIKKAVEEKFKVKVLQTFVIVTKGKRNRIGKRRTEVNVTPWKKAIVKLAKDQKISLFESGAKA
ncbi:MAG: 50S ribosomal protein L23 [Candidatus Levybacteria bacterium]|nr:50S ribosomal protein L23 [Candidatus Levybacteria bacterium]